jgi:hypothetical protein
MDVLPHIGFKAISTITAPELLSILKVARARKGDNPYNELVVSIISREDIALNDTDSITKHTNILATVADKRSLLIRSQKLLAQREQKIKDAYNNGNLLSKASNRNEELANKIIAEHIADHELIYGSGKITSERLDEMKIVSKHEASLEHAMLDEWKKQWQRGNDKLTSPKKSSAAKINHNNIDRFIASTMLQMRQKMNKATFDLNIHKFGDKGHDIVSTAETYQNFVDRISLKYHACVYKGISTYKKYAESQMKYEYEHDRQIGYHTR